MATKPSDSSTHLAGISVAFAHAGSGCAEATPARLPRVSAQHSPAPALAPNTPIRMRFSDGLILWHSNILQFSVGKQLRQQLRKTPEKEVGCCVGLMFGEINKGCVLGGEGLSAPFSMLFGYLCPLCRTLALSTWDWSDMWASCRPRLFTTSVAFWARIAQLTKTLRLSVNMLATTNQQAI